MIQNLIFGILFLKILFRGYNVFIFVQTFQWTSLNFFFNFRFSSRKSQSQQKLAEKITYFTIPFHSKNLSHFTNLNSFDIEICSHNTAKNLSDFINFPANMFLFGVRKNICTKPFLEAQELHCLRTLKANVCIFI